MTVKCNRCGHKFSPAGSLAVHGRVRCPNCGNGGPVKPGPGKPPPRGGTPLPLPLPLPRAA